MPQVFEFQDYRAYLSAALSPPADGARGMQSRLAQALHCQASHVSKVLSGAAQLSLEQADLVNEFLGHSTEQGDYFLLLVELQRAGTQRLKAHYARHLEESRERHLHMQKRFRVRDVLSEKDKATFYSRWYYSAVHALISIPGFQRAAAIAERLKLSAQLTEETLTFLEQSALLTRSGGNWRQTLQRTHLGKDSPFVAQHHLNWRLRGMQSIFENRGTDLHYSTVASLSKDDYYRIKAEFVKAVAAANEVIAASPEETLAVINLDFFEI